MRLNRLHLAGFKSFVEPTDVYFPSNLVGIVGPNGCGKSNLIDAIRWVLGESSAHQLRGQALEDVIFSGASGRKPASQATVELLFDNRDGRIGGEYARYAEIAVRRELSRDGQSRFYLNNTRCRRRDIADLFLGTGLGARSYAIIEQGQVNRIVEARPEELRAYLEEAAGISKYRERRRETAQRVAHTRENLERLTDLREELGRQLARLDRQAKAASRYRELRSEAREIEARLLALKLAQANQTLAKRQAALQQAESRLESLRSRLADQQRTLTEMRAAVADRQVEVNALQASVYELGAKQAQGQMRLAQFKTDIDHALRQQQNNEQALGRLAQLQHEATENVARFIRDLDAVRERIGLLECEQVEAQARLDAAELNMNAVQAKWDAFIEKANEPVQALDQLQKQLAKLEQTLHRDQQAADRIDLARSRHERETAQAQVAAAEEALRRSQAVLKESEQSVDQAEQALHQAKAELAEAEEAFSSARRDFESLTARHQALAEVLRTETNKTNGWSGPRLVDRLAEMGVEDEWLERQLGPALHGWIVEDLAELLETATLPPGQWWVEALKHDGEPSREEHHRWVQDWLDSRHQAGSLAEALAERHRLAPGQAMVTPEGWLIGRHWLQTPGEGQQTGMLARRAALRQLEIELPAAEKVLQQAAADRAAALARYQEAEAILRSAQSQLKQALRDQGQAEVAVTQARALLQRTEVQLRQHEQAQAELAARLDRNKAQCGKLRAEREYWLERKQAMLDARQQLEQQRSQARKALEQARSELERVRRARHEQDLVLNGLQSRIEMAQAEAVRAEREMQDIRARQQHVVERLAQLKSEQEQARQAQAEIDARLRSAEGALAAGQRQLEATQAAEREAAMALVECEREVELARSNWETARLAHQEAALRQEAAYKDYQGCDAVLEGYVPPPVETETMAQLAERLEVVQQQLARLGAVNLTAIDEYNEVAKRKQDLDAQYAELNEALAQLEAAMARMDRETRARFRETFDAVNARLGSIFAQLFGGGEAMLTLDENDALDGGVQLMSRPPGKRISHLSLLSGGEKALTAVALIFALFSLNPAPFCILDELDAPLDEANVGRFCAMVREMAGQVQFVFITHNKATMESASQLIGVTMREPGVSRIVSVDLDRAVQLIESET